MEDDLLISYIRFTDWTSEINTASADPTVLLRCCHCIKQAARTIPIADVGFSGTAQRERERRISC